MTTLALIEIGWKLFAVIVIVAFLAALAYTSSYNKDDDG